MAKLDPQTCEVKVEGAWRAVSLADASGTYRTALKRCPACHGPVAVNGNYTGKVARTLVHRKSHSGCPLKPTTYVGTPSPHPQALA